MHTLEREAAEAAAELLADHTHTESYAPKNADGSGGFDPVGPALDPGTRRSKVVVGLFRKMVPAQIAELEAAVNDDSSERVKALAHKLKGSCLAIGAQAMAALCAQLEPLPEGAFELLELLKNEHKRVLAGLDLED